MAGMEAFGRQWNVCAAAGGVAIKIADASSIAFIATISVAATFTLSISPTFGGSYVNTSIAWNPIVHYYTNGDAGAGTGQWAAVANNAAGNIYNSQGSGSYLVPYTGTIANTNAVVIELLASQVPAGYEYVKCAATTGTATILALTDLDVQRRPSLLPAMSA